jgi:DNA-binding protein H-NS
MVTIAEIDAQIRTLQEQKASMVAEGKKQAINEIKAKMAEYGITANDLQGTGVTTKKAKAERAPSIIKYKKSETETWGGGKGPKPKWVKAVIDAGEDIEKYNVNVTTPATNELNSAEPTHQETANR